MEDNEFLIKGLLKKEEELGLDNYQIDGLPIYRYIRFDLRSNYLKQKTSFANKTILIKVQLYNVILNIFSSLISLFRLLFLGKINNIYFAFPRLSYINGIYLDKFTDPIIESVNDGSYIILQKNSKGNKLKPRTNKGHTYYLDFIDFGSTILGSIFGGIYLIFYKKAINNFCNKLNLVYGENNFNYLVAKNLVSLKLSIFLYKIIFKILKPTNIIGVSRPVFFSAIIAAKKLNINVLELQHGITESETILYSGNFNKDVDPDYFLTFGERWRNKYFGIPVNKIINIGWAFKSFLKYSISNNLPKYKGDVLLISSPSITNQILTLAVQITELDENIKVHIRLHPQEGLNHNQLSKLSENSRINISDRLIESTLAVTQFDKIIGENSSVLYEALSIGLMVAKIDFNHFGHINKEVKRDGFYYLNNADDLINFIYLEVEKSLVIDNGIYDEFKIERFKEITSKI